MYTDTCVEILLVLDGWELHCAPLRHMSLVALCWFSFEICKNKTQNKRCKLLVYMYAWLCFLSRWVRPSANSFGDCSIFFPFRQSTASIFLHRPTRWTHFLPNLVVSMPCFPMFLSFSAYFFWEFPVFQISLNTVIPRLPVIDFHIQYPFCLIHWFSCSWQHKWSHHQFLWIFPSRG